MFSGLYGDLPLAKDEGDRASGGATGGGWAGQGLLMPPTKRPAMMAPPSTLRAGAAGGRGRSRPGPATGAAPGAAPSSGEAAADQTAAQGPTGNRWDAPEGAAVAGFGPEVADEYDPARPNDYDQAARQRDHQRAEAAAESERQERLREIRDLEELERQREGEATGCRTGGDAAAPDGGIAEAEARRAAALQLSGEEAFLRRGGLFRPEHTPSDVAVAAGPAPGAAGQPKGMTLAQRMLEKMGWKEGGGLGRDLQGISEPLEVQKTAERSGTIVSAPPARLSPVGQGGSDAAPPRALPPDAGAPSRVIVLRNLVGPGQVDESLEEEIGRSAERHGEVESVLIFEVTQPGFPAEEAVRVFVEFETAAAAAAALRDMHGRFFGGRVVAGRFFDEGRFAAGELAPLAGEVAPP